jgi:hypothetical protein
MERPEMSGSLTALDLALRILALTEEQRAAAAADDWIRALDCADRRAELVMAIGSLDLAALDPCERNRLVEILARVQAHDEETVERARQARLATIEALDELGRRRVMARGYRRVTSLPWHRRLVDDQA